ncbi:metal-dependent hydrolase [Candidatus Woesearchaeota archaeon]|nr:metal-dependent hydrolase [Candidatus Woesearchaeota archaeon]
MMTPTHAITGMFVLFILNSIVPEMFPFSGLLIILSLIFPMLPDLDGLWVEKMKDHHQTFTHAPLFWLGLSIILYLFVPIWIPILLLAQLAGHFIGDYLAGFSAGIAWLYPFNKKETSLFPLKKEMGDFPIFAKTKEDKEKRKKFNQEYYKQKKLLTIELISGLLGIVFFVIGLIN